jgi:hypothetical protein
VGHGTGIGTRSRLQEGRGLPCTAAIVGDGGTQARQIEATGVPFDRLGDGAIRIAFRINSRLAEVREHLVQARPHVRMVENVVTANPRDLSTALSEKTL